MQSKSQLLLQSLTCHFQNVHSSLTLSRFQVHAGTPMYIKDVTFFVYEHTYWSVISKQDVFSKLTIVGLALDNNLAGLFLSLPWFWSWLKKCRYGMELFTSNVRPTLIYFRFSVHGVKKIRKPIHGL
jgi:hypothetical protein